MRIFVILFLLISTKTFSQNSNSIWCFGDSAGIDFSNISNPVTFASGMDGRGSCASISDSSGSLLFYADTRAGFLPQSGLIYNKLHQIMQNGDSINGEAWYNELTIVPIGNNIFYLFSIGETWTPIQGFFYSIIDMNQNGGLGAVMQKNIQLNSIRNADCVQAIKHGNGRDWWIISKYSKNNPNTQNNRFYVYLVTPSGISAPLVQNLSNATDGDRQKIIFNSTGNKIMHINVWGFLAEYDFNRCTGIISNQNIIFPEQSTSHRIFSDGAYSPNDSIFYISVYASSLTDTMHLLQCNLFDTNIVLSCDTLDSFLQPINTGAVRLAPDGKIYFSCLYDSGVANGYPYPDSVRNIYNKNLGVINYPDSIGSSCNFQPFSFYLGGKRTYFGLPNNPNYSLGPWAGSPCDTLGVGILNIEHDVNSELFVFYHMGWQTVFINAKRLKGRNYLLRIFDLMGNEVYKEQGRLNSEYFTKDIQIGSFSREMYFVTIQTEKEKLIKKFVKE